MLWLRVLFIYFTFLIAFFISTIPWTMEFMVLKPYWVFVLLLYWSTFASRIVGYITTLVLGVLYDSFSGAPLGQYGLSFLLVIVLNHKFDEIYRSTGLVIQAILVLFLLIIFSLINLVLGLFSFQALDFGLKFWLPIITSTLLWVGVKLSLDWASNKLFPTIKS